jgi:plastocyanin domain-containing protein
MKIFFGLMLLLALLMGGYLLMNLSDTATETDKGTNANVSVVEGTQIIELRARGGYSPKVSVVKAGMPTILRVNTEGTFDCSAAIRIPSLKVSKMLPANGSTDIDLGTLEAGLISGNCAMGMYPFEIRVE